MIALALALPFVSTYLHVSLGVVRRHSPRWLAVLIGIALLIPGPQDEALVALIVLVMIAVKPALRAELREVWSC